MEQDDIKKILLEHKLTVLRESSNPTTLWWVSSVVFCGSIIGALLFNLNKFGTLDPLMLNALFLIIVLFFLTITTFGIYTVIKIYQLEKEVISILNQLDTSILCKGTEADVLKMGLILGSTSFVFCTAIIIIMWVSVVST